MPEASQLFQQIAGNQPAPFQQYLRPVQERPIDQPTPGATGWESQGVGLGQIALGFLKGVRQNRVADYLEQEKNAQASQDLYIQDVNTTVHNNDDLNQMGRDALGKMALDTMNAHSQYETKDIKDGHGVAGFFKNLMVNLSGGPMKVRQPIHFPTESGKLHQELLAHPEYSQKHVFEQATIEAQQALDALKRTNPYPTAPEAQGAVINAYKKVLAGAPKYEGAFMQVTGVPMGAIYPAVGSLEAMANEQRRRAAARQSPPIASPQAPPQPPPEMNFSPIAGSTPIQRPFTQAPPVAGNVHPVDSGTGSPGDSEYVPGLGPDDFALVDNRASRPGSGINKQAAHLVSLPSGRRTGAVLIGGAVDDPALNGYWDPQTGRKFSGNIVPVSLAQGRRKLETGPGGYAMLFDYNQNRNVYDLDPEGNRYIPPKGSVAVTDADGNDRWMSASEATARGMITGAQGRFEKSVAARKELQQIGIKATNARTAHQDLIATQTRYAAAKNAINARFTSMIDSVRRGQLNILTSAAAGLNRPLSQRAIEQAKTNPQSLIAEIEAQRQEQLKAVDDQLTNAQSAVYEAFPELRGGAAATAGLPLSETPPPNNTPGGGTRLPIPSADAINSMYKH